MSEEFLYSVRVKNGAGWRKYSRMRLMISVGKEYHEGNKLSAIVDWINRNSEIQEVQVSVNDFLQRHNLIAFGMSDEQAESVARCEGTAWIERNEEILSGIKTSWSFTRWEEWFGTPSYYDAHAALLDYAKSNASFDEVLQADALTLTKRRIKRGEFVPSRLEECSRHYVLEELAVFALQSRVFPAAEVYPGTSLLSVSYLLNKPLPEILCSLSKRYTTRVDFERRKNTLIQPLPSPISDSIHRCAVSA